MNATMGGYLVRAETLKHTYVISVDQGVRGYNVPCVVEFNQETGVPRVFLKGKELGVTEWDCYPAK